MTQENFNRGKFSDIDKDYFYYIDELLKSNVDKKDLIYNFPVYVGSVNLGRFLFFYDLYKQIYELNGHIADIGTYKGASLLTFAKLVKLFEPYNITQVYGFDWFKGMQASSEDNSQYDGQYVADYEQLSKLIELQKLDNIAVLHKMDIEKETDDCMKDNPYMKFKLVFVDCGIKNVLEKSLENFWPRIINGGILIMDHYNGECSPAESNIVDKYIGKNHIKQMPFNRQPTGYIIKQ